MRDLLAGLTDFFGVQAGSYDSLTLSKMQTMIDTVMRRATQEGAQVIIGAQMIVRPVPAKRMSMIQLTFTGTMVRYRESIGHAKNAVEHDGQSAPTHSSSARDAAVL